MTKKWTAAICLCALLSLGGFSASAQFKQTLRAVRVDKGPKLDGYLDDKVWEQAVPFTDFKMAEPKPNSQPSEKTELRVIYDRDNLYLGVHCYDGEPSKISALTMAHDSVEEEGMGDDLLRVLLDPFQDKRNAYVFFINPRGARSEGLASGESYSLNWDGIWDARARISKDGWSAEIRIPFKTISFEPRLEYWGLNMERDIPRKQEIVRISGTTLDSFFYNPNEASPLEGVAGVRQGMGLTIRPFGKASAVNDFEPGSKYEQHLDGGIDIYKNFAPNLVGAFSYNTDFAETEVDERQVNLTRFPLFFPEKRTFFLEGSEVFNFGPSGGFQYHASFIPFFSRRIGLYEGNQVPIMFGAKMYGKIGNTNLGFLDVQTQKFSEIGLRSDNFFAGRVSQNLWSQSKVGMIFTNGDPSGGSNQLVGLDFVYSTSQFQGDKNFSTTLWSVYNWNNEKSGKPYGFGFKVDYPNDLWDLSLAYDYFGDRLYPGLGFLPRKNIQMLSSGIAYSPRPEKGWFGKWVRQFNFMVYPQFYWDLKGRLETYEIMVVPLSFHTDTGHRFEFAVIPNRDVLPFDFEVSEGVVIPKGAYNFTNLNFEYNSPTYLPFFVDVEYRFGQFYSGRLNEAELKLIYQLKGYVQLGLESNFIRGRLREGNFNETVYQVRADFYASPNLGLMNYIQYDSVSKNLGVNIRLRWQISPGNEVFLVYNKNWERRWDPSNRYTPVGEYAAIKVQFSIRP
jgi:hypothetical protein